MLLEPRGDGWGTKERVIGSTTVGLRRKTLLTPKHSLNDFLEPRSGRAL